MSIIDVAKAAGVSTATVSRVMNDLPGVRTETVALVRAAIEELNYKPRRTQMAPNGAVAEAGPRPKRRRRRGGSVGAIGVPVPLAPGGPSALSLELGLRTGNIGVVTVGHSPTWLELPVLAAALGGVQRGLSELGLRLMLEEMRDPAKPTSALLNRQVDGAVVFLSSDLSGSSVTQVFASIRACVPCVWAMGMSVADDVVDHVTVDNVAIGHLAAGHLRTRGCRHLAFLATDAEWSFVRLRGQSFLNRARDERADSTVAYLAGADDRTAAAYGADLVREVDLDGLIRRLAADVRRRDSDAPTGVFVYNDFTLSRAYPLLAHHGLHVGRDVEVISCDAERARLDGMIPRPESINVGADEIGFRAVVRLLARIQRPDDRLLTIHVAPRL